MDISLGVAGADEAKRVFRAITYQFPLMSRYLLLRDNSHADSNIHLEAFCRGVSDGVVKRPISEARYSISSTPGKTQGNDYADKQLASNVCKSNKIHQVSSKPQ